MHGRVLMKRRKEKRKGLIVLTMSKQEAVTIYLSLERAVEESKLCLPPTEELMILLRNYIREENGCASS